MWPFSRPPRDPELAGVIYEGSFVYTGGFPGYEQPGSTWRASEVIITETGLTYWDKANGAWRNLFTIPVQSVRRVDQIPWIPPRLRGGALIPDTYQPAGQPTKYVGNYVTVEMDYNGQVSTAGFRTTYEKADYELYGALNVMLAHQPTHPFSGDPDERPVWPVQVDSTILTSVSYEGRFLYAGGHPMCVTSGNSWHGANVFVTEGGITYRDTISGRWLDFFVIDADSIRRVEYTPMARGTLRLPYPAHFSTIEMEQNGRTFRVRFRAGSQKQAVDLTTAVKAMLTRQGIA